MNSRILWTVTANFLELIEYEISISLDVTSKASYGVSFASRYSGVEVVIFSAAISSKCNHLLISLPFVREIPLGLSIPDDTYIMSALNILASMTHGRVKDQPILLRRPIVRFIFFFSDKIRQLNIFRNHYSPSIPVRLLTDRIVSISFQTDTQNRSFVR